MNSPDPPKILFDSSTRVHSDLLEGATIDHEVMWGDRKQQCPVVGYVRKKSGTTEDQQFEIDALFTIGRLIREGKILAYSTHEIQIELFRGRMRTPDLNAFEGCSFSDCLTPLHRSKFRQTMNSEESISKGGKKDRKKGFSDFTQIGFMSWLLELEPSAYSFFAKHKDNLKLTDFELDSLRDLKWFQSLSSKLRSKENLPDAFHVWTARRNNMNVFLTLDKKLSNSIETIRSEKNLAIESPPPTIRPRAFLKSLGIEKLDEIPVESGKFYYLQDIQQLKQNNSIEPTRTSRADSC